LGAFDKFLGGLKKTRESINQKVEVMLNSFTKIDDELFLELEEILVMSDVGAITSNKLCEDLRIQVKHKGITDPLQIKDMLKEVIAKILEDTQELKLSTKPSIILVIGVNGAGKTTTIGKLAYMLTQQGKKVILGAADTFRAAAIDQLQIWADRAKVDMIKHAQDSDPAAVIFDTINAARARGMDVAICDTAGRLHNKKNLMEELAKITRVIKREAPESDLEVLLVLDATTGQNAVNQAKLFMEVASITGIVLTKLDGTARGGVVVAIKNELGLSVKLVGVGEQIDDLQFFDAKAFTDAMIG
jgi:fused signal recognition particle receptor